MLNQPPNNHQAELAVLGCLLLTPGIMPDVRELLTTECFYEPAHQKIYGAMLRVNDSDSPLDFVTLTEELKQRSQLEGVGGVSFISSLTDYVATAANVERYRDLVFKDYTLRKMIDIGHTLTQSCYEQGNPEEIFNETEKALLSLNQGGSKNTVKMARDLVAETITEMERKNDGETVGLTTGFRELDLMTGGFRPGQLIVVGGRPGMGKTSLALNIAVNIAVKGHEKPQEQRSVLIFSIEMGAQSILQRALSDVANVPSYRIRNRRCDDSDMGSVVYGAGKIYESLLAIDDSANLTPAHVLSRARRFKSKHGLSLVVIDYLQLMSSGVKTDNEQHSVSYISSTMKRIARELEVPVVLLSQLNRMLESREDKRPKLSDLRSSGSIEQDADIVAGVHRPVKFSDQADPRKVELIILKHRDGQTGIIDLRFNEQYTRFEDA